MGGCAITADEIQRIVDFHGHWCPGLAVGIRAGEYVVENLGRAADEEIVAVVETDMCGIDAIQVLTGCTFGKGNLIYRDLGKMAFSFFNRQTGQGVRLVFKPGKLEEGVEGFAELNRRWLRGQATEEEKAQLMEMRESRATLVMSSPFEEVFTVKAPNAPMPREARILESLVCDKCGEAVMESRTRRLEGRTMCISCFQSEEDRFCE